MLSEKSFKIGVLASTNGTNLQVIIDQIQSGELPVELVVVGSNKECFALKRSKEQGLETIFIDQKMYKKQRQAFDQAMLDALAPYNVDLIVLVGYMRVITPLFIASYSERILNIHPSLIPKYCGKGMYGNKVHEAVLSNNETETGMTIHYVDEGVDTGKILCQKSVSIDDSDTVETLKQKVQALEKEWYPKIIKQLALEYQE
jgi:phosphoribosylglycinamide formyltransferase-1